MFKAFSFCQIFVHLYALTGVFFKSNEAASYNVKKGLGKNALNLLSLCQGN